MLQNFEFEKNARVRQGCSGPASDGAANSPRFRRTARLVKASENLEFNKDFAIGTVPSDPIAYPGINSDDTLGPFIAAIAVSPFWLGRSIPDAPQPAPHRLGALSVPPRRVSLNFVHRRLGSRVSEPDFMRRRWNFHRSSPSGGFLRLHLRRFVRNVPPKSTGTRPPCVPQDARGTSRSPVITRCEITSL